MLLTVMGPQRHSVRSVLSTTAPPLIIYSAERKEQHQVHLIVCRQILDRQTTPLYEKYEVMVGQWRRKQSKANQATRKANQEVRGKGFKDIILLIKINLWSKHQ